MFLTREKAQEFAAKLKEIEAWNENQRSDDDVRHVLRFERVGLLGQSLGYLLAPFMLNAFSVLALLAGLHTRQILAHFVHHGGYEHYATTPERLRRRGFGKGWRVVFQYFNWIPARAWCFEHNGMHHPHLGSAKDPGTTETIFKDFAKPKNLFQRLAMLTTFILTWNQSYFGPNALTSMMRRKSREGGFVADFFTWINPFTKLGRKVYLECWLPTLFFRFVIPIFIAGALFGVESAWLMAGNLVIVDFLANVFSFMIILPNHAGGDLYRFSTESKCDEDQLLRMIVASANMPSGTWLDPIQGYLNLHIEHHLWPSMSMRDYQRVAPKVKALCKDFDVPYVNENIFLRTYRACRNIIGLDYMEVLPGALLPSSELKKAS